MTNKITYYDEQNQVKTETHYDLSVDETTGEIIEHPISVRTFYGEQSGFWKLYLKNFLMILGKFNFNALKVMCFICENVSAGDNIFLGTIEIIAEKTELSRSTVIRCMKKLIEFDFIRMIAKGQYMINPRVMCVGGGSKQPGKERFLIELYDGVTNPSNNKITHKRRYKTKSMN